MNQGAEIIRSNPDLTQYSFMKMQCRTDDKAIDKLARMATTNRPLEIHEARLLSNMPIENVQFFNALEPSAH